MTTYESKKKMIGKDTSTHKIHSLNLEGAQGWSKSAPVLGFIDVRIMLHFLGFITKSKTIRATDT